MNLMFFYCFNLLFVSFSLQINAEFNKHFANFIVENYGKSFLDILERKDLGPGGSFGGRTVEDEEINRDPVIFVHGVSDIAEGKMQSLAEIYRKQGYSDGELYSTTYASGAKNNPVSWAEYSLKCSYVKQKKSRVLSRQITSASPIDNDFLQTTVKPVKSTTLNSQVTDTYHSNNIVNSHGMQEKHIITTMETAQEADFIADKGEGYHTRFQISLDKQNK
uniref:Triacylglycerol lipase n=1 Tax=Caenorhabditis japonica TaxID=281687 RepID=A0A8R1DMK0_CAEJA